jgi:hypothetical protein
LHGCDNTAWVRVSWPGETAPLHVVGGSQRDNMEMMGRTRRGGGRPVVRRGIPRLDGPSRKQNTRDVTDSTRFQRVTATYCARTDIEREKETMR